jgi:hypothetical protein
MKLPPLPEFEKPRVTPLELMLSSRDSGLVVPLESAFL